MFHCLNNYENWGWPTVGYFPLSLCSRGILHLYQVKILFARLQEEFAALVRSLNAEVGLNNMQLELIQEEVWSTFNAHVALNGLTLEGLKQIYLDGYADLDRDYDALIKARHGDAENGNAALASHPVGLHALRKQSEGGDASPQARTPAPASPDVYSTLATPAQGGASTEDELDIFNAVQTPAPVADYTKDLAFAVRLPGITSETEFDAGATRRNLLAALKDALPEGTATRIVSSNPTPLGLAVGVVCCLPEGAMGGEEEEYFTAVLAAEPEQVFPHSIFGPVEVLSADPTAACGGSTAAECAAESLAAATRAGAPGQVPLAFSIRLADVNPTEFKDNKGGYFMAQVWSSLPVGSAARVVDVSPSAGGCVVTVAAAVPAARSQQAQQFIRKLRNETNHVFDATELGSAALVTGHQPKFSRPTITVKVRLPGQCTSDVTAPADVASALGRALPTGSSAVVCAIEDSPRGTSAVMTLSAALPLGTDARGVEAAVDSVCTAQGWIPADTTAPGDGPAECMRVGSMLDSAFNGEGDGLEDLHFGVTAAKSPKAAHQVKNSLKSPKGRKDKNKAAAKSKSPPEQLEQQAAEGATPVGKPAKNPSFMKRLFSRSASKKNVQLAEPEPVVVVVKEEESESIAPSPMNAPPSPVINGLLNGHGKVLDVDGELSRRNDGASSDGEEDEGDGFHTAREHVVTIKEEPVENEQGVIAERRGGGDALRSVPLFDVQDVSDESSPEGSPMSSQRGGDRTSSGTTPERGGSFTTAGAGGNAGAGINSNTTEGGLFAGIMKREDSKGSIQRGDSSMLRLQRSGGSGSRGGLPPIPINLVERSRSSTNSVSGSGGGLGPRQKSSGSLAKEMTSSLRSHSIRSNQSAKESISQGSRGGHVGGGPNAAMLAQRRMSDASSTSSGAALAAAAAAADSERLRREYSANSLRRENSLKALQSVNRAMASVQSSGQLSNSSSRSNSRQNLDRQISDADSVSSGAALAAAAAVVDGGVGVSGMVRRTASSSSLQSISHRQQQQDSPMARSQSFASRETSVRSDASRGGIPTSPSMVPPVQPQQQQPRDTAGGGGGGEQPMSPGSQVGALRERSNASLRSSSSKNSSGRMRRSLSDPSLNGNALNGAASDVGSPMDAASQHPDSPLPLTAAGGAAAAAAAAAGVIRMTAYPGPADSKVQIVNGGDQQQQQQQQPMDEDIDDDDDDDDDGQYSVYSDAASSAEKSPRKGSWLSRIMSSNKRQETAAGGGSSMNGKNNHKPAAPMSEPPSPPPGSIINGATGSRSPSPNMRVHLAPPSQALSEASMDVVGRPSPFEVQRRMVDKESSVINTQVKQLINKLNYVIDHGGKGKPLDAEVSAIQDTASMLPTAARFAAHMDIGEKLAQKQM